jgi:hypothetical protein
VRAHFSRPVTNQAGDLLPNVQVFVYEPGTTTLITDVVYSADTGTAVLTNPFVSDTGLVDFYLDNPKRVRLGIVQGTSPIQYQDGIDVIAAGSDSLHLGAGLQSIVIGTGASAAGNQSTAVGTGANSTGASSTALGNAASSLGLQSVAVGPAAVQGSGAIGIGTGATATGNYSVVIGKDSSAALDDGTAVGHGAVAAYAHSTAIGPGAVSTGPNQVMLGTATDTVEVPFGSGYVIKSPNGTRYKITVDNSGALITTAL